MHDKTQIIKKKKNHDEIEPPKKKRKLNPQNENSQLIPKKTRASKLSYFSWIDIFNALMEHKSYRQAGFNLKIGDGKKTRYLYNLCILLNSHLKNVYDSASKVKEVMENFKKLAKLAYIQDDSKKQEIIEAMQKAGLDNKLENGRKEVVYKEKKIQTIKSLVNICNHYLKEFDSNPPSLPFFNNQNENMNYFLYCNQVYSYINPYNYFPITYFPYPLPSYTYPNWIPSNLQNEDIYNKNNPLNYNQFHDSPVITQNSESLLHTNNSEDNQIYKKNTFPFFYHESENTDTSTENSLWFVGQDLNF